jgi:hypothetical protein
MGNAPTPAFAAHKHQPRHCGIRKRRQLAHLFGCLCSAICTRRTRNSWSAALCTLWGVSTFGTRFGRPRGQHPAVAERHGKIQGPDDDDLRATRGRMRMCVEATKCRGNRAHHAGDWYSRRHLATDRGPGRACEQLRRHEHAAWHAWVAYRRVFMEISYI